AREIGLDDAVVGTRRARTAGEEPAAELRVGGEEALAVLDLAREVGRLGQREPVAREANGRREHARERQAAEAAVERHQARHLAWHADGEPTRAGEPGLGVPARAGMLGGCAAGDRLAAADRDGRPGR